MVPTHSLYSYVRKVCWDIFNIGLYDIHIELKHAPLLQALPHAEMVWIYTADIMSRALVVLRLEMPGHEVLGLMNGCTHNAFPVMVGEKFFGMVTRKAVYKVLFPEGTLSPNYIVNFSFVVDPGIYVVHEGTSVRRTYALFRQLGLRHLPVLSTDGRLVGIVTRKDLAFFVTKHAQSWTDGISSVRE